MIARQADEINEMPTGGIAEKTNVIGIDLDGLAPAARPLHEVGVLPKCIRGALVVVGVQDEQDRPVAHERQLPEERRVVRGALDALRQPSVEQRLVKRLEHLELVLRRLVAAARRLFGLVEAAFHQLDVAEYEFCLHEVDVRPWVEPFAHMRDFGVREGANHVRHGVYAADVGEEAIAEALAAAGAFRKAGDVDHVDGRVDLAGSLEDLVEPVEPRVGHGDDAQVGFGRGERVGGRRRVGVGQRVEQGGLADVGQTDDAELHGCLPSLLVSRTSSTRERSRSWPATRPGYLFWT